MSDDQLFRPEDIRCGIYEGAKGPRRAVFMSGTTLIKYHSPTGKYYETTREEFAAWARRTVEPEWCDVTLPDGRRSTEWRPAK